MRHLALSLTVFILVVMTSFSNIKRLSVASSAFSNNGIIPVKYSCEGTEASPPLRVSGMPGTTRSLALIVHDPDAPMQGGFTHWVMWNIDINGEIPENFTGASQGLNGAKQKGYKGMCPPSGVHHYHFYVYALDTKLDLKDADKAALEKAMQGHILAEGELVGLYKKTK